ncbi:MAG: flagellar motor protein MotB [Alphaproteobacteria bacterium]
MAGVNDQQAIIIKRVKGGHAHAHHGGAWKVAYADFVTAMMAFFLLLWLLNATTEEQKSGISNYFSPDSVSQSKSGAGGVLGGTTVSLNGVLSADGGPTIGTPIAAMSMTAGEDTDFEQGGEADAEEQGQAEGETEGSAQGGLGKGNPDKPGRVDNADLDKLLAEREEERFEAAAAALRQAIESVPELAKLSESLLIDQTPEGLRIQLVDQEQYSMFPLGSTEPNEQARKLFAMVAQVVGKMPNRISVSGHTDARPYRSERGYTNWELSSDRANAARRLLSEGGLPVERIALVQGRADTEPLVPDDPMSARNRRISLVLLREAGDKGGPRIAPADAAGTRQATTPAPGSTVPANAPAGIAPAAEPVENRAETPLPSLFGRRPG